MSKYLELYLENMTHMVCEIMKKSELTQQDIQFIALYRSELKRYEHTPLFTKIMNGAKSIKQIMLELENTDDKESILKTEGINDGV